MGRHYLISLFKASIITDGCCVKTSRQMEDKRIVPDDPLAFIKKCVRGRRVFWTLHVNMRLRSRFISREMIQGAIESYEIIECYPEDKYLPSYLVYGQHGGEIFHVLFGVDVPEEKVRVVTAYRPQPEEWSRDLKRRIKP